MGGSITAKCSCGYEASSRTGGGMLSFHETCYWPGYCGRCRELVRVNVLSERLRCPRCRGKVVPYDDPVLCGRVGSEEVTHWRGEELVGRILSLHNGDYLCPRCGEYSLRFADDGFSWD